MKKINDYNFTDSQGVWRYEEWVGEGAEECPKCGGCPQESVVFGSKNLDLFCLECGHRWEVEREVKVSLVKVFDRLAMFGPDGEMIIPGD